MESLLKVYVNNCYEIPAQQLNKLNDEMLFSHLRFVLSEGDIEDTVKYALNLFHKMDEKRVANFIINKFEQIYRLNNDFIQTILGELSNLNFDKYFFEKYLEHNNFRLYNENHVYLARFLEYLFILPVDSIKKFIDANWDGMKNNSFAFNFVHYNFNSGHKKYLVNNENSKEKEVYDYIFETNIDKINNKKNCYFLFNVFFINLINNHFDFIDKKKFVTSFLNNLVNNPNIEVVNEKILRVLFNENMTKNFITCDMLNIMINSDKFIFITGGQKLHGYSEGYFDNFRKILNKCEPQNYDVIVNNLSNKNRIAMPKFW